MLGDICGQCHQEVTDHGCGCGTGHHHHHEALPCLPDCTGECSVWIPLSCAFWMGDDIPGTPIRKGTPMSIITTYLLQRLAEAEGRITELEL